ncbi:MAG: CBS domain-containing protein [Flavobacteriia bacterium]|nr:CBS domain-containing protein [Flavobacteriia bacterium]
MKKRVPISQIMAKEVVSLNPVQTLYDAEDLFEKHKIRHLPVVDGENLIGVLSKSDLLRISYSELSDDEESVESMIFDAYTIPQVMTKTPVTVDSEATVRDVAEVFAKQSFHALPVVDHGKLVGMITTTDLINYLLDQY